MKIYFCGKPVNTEDETPRKMSLDTRALARIEYALNAEKARICDRANLRAETAFEIVRYHSNSGAAQDFAVSHAGEFSTSGILKIETDSGKAFAMSDAAATRIKTSLDGISTITSYEFQSTTPTSL